MTILEQVVSQNAQSYYRGPWVASALNDYTRLVPGRAPGPWMLSRVGLSLYAANADMASRVVSMTFKHELENFFLRVDVEIENMSFGNKLGIGYSFSGKVVGLWMKTSAKSTREEKQDFLRMKVEVTSYEVISRTGEVYFTNSEGGAR